MPAQTRRAWVRDYCLQLEPLGPPVRQVECPKCSRPVIGASTTVCSRPVIGASTTQCSQPE